MAAGNGRWQREPLVNAMADSGASGVGHADILCQNSLFYPAEAISQGLEKKPRKVIVKSVINTPPGSWSFTPLSGTDEYHLKCFN